MSEPAQGRAVSCRLMSSRCQHPGPPREAWAKGGGTCESRGQGVKGEAPTCVKAMDPLAGHSTNKRRAAPACTLGLPGLYPFPPSPASPMLLVTCMRAPEWQPPTTHPAACYPPSRLCYPAAACHMRNVLLPGLRRAPERPPPPVSELAQGSPLPPTAQPAAVPACQAQ